MKKVLTFTVLFVILNITMIKAQDGIVYNETAPESELHAAINPTDTLNMVVAAINNFANDGSLSVYYTLDFGNTWQQSSFHGVPPANYEGAGDPVLKFDDKGTVYLTNLSSDVSGSGEPAIHTIMSYSTDKGITWQSLTANNATTNDKPWLAVDKNPVSPHYGKKYNVTIIGNVDAKITTFDNTNTIIVNSVSVFSGVSVHIPNIECANNGNVFVSAYDTNNDKILIAKSTDGGQSFGTHTTIASVSLIPNDDNIIGIPDRLQLSPSIAIDNSGGANDGRIYMTYTDREAGSAGGSNTKLDTYLTWSDDDGQSWTTAKILNAGAAANTQQYYSNIFVNNQGEVLFGWYDRRDDTNHKNTDYYIGISKDGGTTITELKVTSASSDFSLIGSQNGNFGIGEYCQIVATENTAIPFWSDGRTNNGDINIYFAKIDINNPSTGIQEISSISDKISIGTVYPNPAINNAEIKINLKEKTNLHYKIIDITGKEVNSSAKISFPAGKSRIELVLNTLQTGIYFLKITSGKGFIKTIKIMKK